MDKNNNIGIFTNKQDCGGAITVVDSLMGSGKTSWAIDYMNNNRDENIVYVTPFLSEVERIRKGVRDRKVDVPMVKGKGGKMANFLCLVCSAGMGDVVATTHALFKEVDENGETIIFVSNYTLILDETLDAVSPYTDITHDTFVKLLYGKHCVDIDGETGKVSWVDMNLKDADLGKSINDFKTHVINGNLFSTNRESLIWQFPKTIFDSFRKTYILTYMFDASIMNYYFNLHGIGHGVKNIGVKDGIYGLVDYFKPDISKYKDLIHIHKANMEQRNRYALCKKWFHNADKETLKKLKNIIYNFIHNIIKAKSKDVMWTTFKDYKYYLKGEGYTKGFVEWNCRSSNEYSDRTCLVFALNVFPNVGVREYFKSQKITTDEDMYALSMIVQWIWRSAIRNGKEIDVLIISDRMRTLFEKWLDGEL